MFFETSDLSVTDLCCVVKSDIVSTCAGHTDGYCFNMLSFRANSNIVFETEQEKIATKSGDIIFFPAFNGYSFSGTKDSLISVYFYSNNCLLRRIKKFTPPNSEYYARKFEELYDCWMKKFVGYKYECMSILYKILTKIERDYAQIHASDVHETMFELIDFIHDNFADKSLTVASLAKKCFMSTTYFRQIFTKAYGVTPLKYINDLKINYALELLTTTKISVSEAAHRAGFADPNYFSVVAKKKLGMPPTEYISRMNNESNLQFASHIAKR